MRGLMTKDEAQEVLAAHLAFEAADGVRKDEWYAGVDGEDMHFIDIEEEFTGIP